MIRELISKFNRSLSEHMVAARRRHAAPIRVWFDPDSNTERSRESARSACVLGETVDISRTGIGFLVPSIRVKEKYLVGQDRNLNVEIDLPTGKIRLTAIGRRYKKVGVHISSENFLVGADIRALTGADKQNYESFLSDSARGVKVPAATLKLGID